MKIIVFIRFDVFYKITLKSHVLIYQISPESPKCGQTILKRQLTGINKIKNV